MKHFTALHDLQQHALGKSSSSSQNRYQVKLYLIFDEFVGKKLHLYIHISVFPSVGSCHHGMARPLGCGWGSRPPDMEVSCEYIE